MVQCSCTGHIVAMQPALCECAARDSTKYLRCDTVNSENVSSPPKTEANNNK